MKNIIFLIFSILIANCSLNNDSKYWSEDNNKRVEKTEEEWKKELTPEQYHILREKGTEVAFTGKYWKVTSEGVYHCAGCDTPLFSSDTKYKSGSGWPSFYDHVAGAIDTKKDYKLIFPRTEYHCAQCGGHHGHVFKDGPEPTGLRYCNNGVALKFVPKDAS